MSIDRMLNSIIWNLTVLVIYPLLFAYCVYRLATHGMEWYTVLNIMLFIPWMQANINELTERLSCKSKQ